MANRRKKPEAPLGIYTVSGDEDGRFHLMGYDGNPEDGDAQYIEAGLSVQTQLEYAGEWNAVPCSVFVEHDDRGLGTYVWLFMAPRLEAGVRLSTISRARWVDVQAGKDEIVVFGDATYAPLRAMPSDLNGLKALLAKATKRSGGDQPGG